MNESSPAPQAASEGGAAPLVVGVEGALLGDGLVAEGAFRWFAASPLASLSALVRPGEGRAALKRRVAEAVPLPLETLAPNPAVLDEIAAAQAGGRAVWLASAADERAVAPLAEALGAAGCFASDGVAGMAGETRAAALAARFGEAGFDYIGGGRGDLAVWRRARRAIAVAPSKRLARAVRALDAGARLLPGVGGGPADRLRALRPHQWVKNALVFVPLVAAHETAAALWLAAVGVFVALSAVASAAYLLNDALDLPHDRRHASKRHRPLASGRIRLLPAVALAAALAAGGLALAFALSFAAGGHVALYAVGTCAYSLFLKRRTFIDVVALAALYATRVLAGAAAVSVPLSPWFLAFFMFLFLALAIAKRLGELASLRESGRASAAGRAYVAGDLPTLASLGAASGFSSAVVLALYFQSPEVGAQYGRPELLWLTCPIPIYWLGRVMLLASRGVLDDDPVVFALRDRVSQAAGAAVLAAFVAAL